MRWLWVDRFTEFVSGSHAAGLKNVSLVEEAVDGYCPARPTLPSTLIIEGMAQIGGILVAEHFGFDKRVVLAKITRAIYHHDAVPGDQLMYRVKLGRVGSAGATVSATSHRRGSPPVQAGGGTNGENASGQDVAGQDAASQDEADQGAADQGAADHDATDQTATVLQAEIDLMFAFLEGDQFPEKSLFRPGDLNTMLSIMGMFDVAVDTDGQPLSIPHEKL